MSGSHVSLKIIFSRARFNTKGAFEPQTFVNIEMPSETPVIVQRFAMS